MTNLSQKIGINNTEELLLRLVGDQAQMLSTTSGIVNKGINFIVSELTLPPNNDLIEERAVLNYYTFDQDKEIEIIYILDQNISAFTQVKVIQIQFNHLFFDHYSNSITEHHKLFANKKNIEQAFAIHAQSREFLDTLLSYNNEFTSFTNHIELEIALLNLLKFALQGYINPDEANSFPACSFLNNNYERDKILLAKKIINANLNSPLTIRALARECGINECYLKKGFKAMFGKTILEYREYKRIEKSKELILNGNYNINEVAAEMGYTSHAYFSTAFKKIAGIKPCDLLA